MPNTAPFAIIRTTKIKSWSSLTKSVGHALRTSKDDRQHCAQAVAEPIRIVMGSSTWVDDWSKSVANMWLPELKQGTNHTLAREFFLGASPEFFEGKGKSEINDWIDENVSWLIERFGKEKIKLICAHFDEQVPHISCFVVGLKKDINRKGEINIRGNGWTLSDGVLKLGGSKEAFVKLQDEYSDAMKKFSLRRGLKKSNAKHKTIEQWRKQMATPLETLVVIPRAEKPTEQDRNNIEAYGKRVADKTAHAIYEQMKPYHQIAKSQAGEVKRLRTLVERLEPIAEAFKRLLGRLLGHSPRLDTIQGLNDAQSSANRLIDAVSPRPTGVSPIKPPVSPPEVTPASVPKPRSSPRPFR